MNKLEEFVYKRVKNNYILKDFLRNMYQGFYDLLPNYDSKFQNEPIVLEDCFFGFHDVKPFSINGDKLLSNKLTIPLRMPTKEDILKIGYFSGENFSEWHQLDETRAWNYHKGCRLQWIDESHVIYNSSDGKALYSTICSLTTGDKRQIN
jgi:hypothetical protein